MFCNVLYWHPISCRQKGGFRFPKFGRAEFSTRIVYVTHQHAWWHPKWHSFATWIKSQLQTSWSNKKQNRREARGWEKVRFLKNNGLCGVITKPCYATTSDYWQLALRSMKVPLCSILHIQTTPSLYTFLRKEEFLILLYIKLLASSTLQSHWLASYYISKPGLVLNTYCTSYTRTDSTSHTHSHTCTEHSYRLVIVDSTTNLTSSFVHLHDSTDHGWMVSPSCKTKGHTQDTNTSEHNLT